MSEETTVGWNHTDAARSAAEWALERASRTRDAVRLVRVLSRQDTEADTGLVDVVASELDDEITRLQMRAPAVDLRIDIVVGDTIDELRRFSEPDALLVVGTDERLQPQRSSGWSIGARLASSCPGPVAVVPIFAEMRERHGIVVGVDTGQSDHAALSFAAREAIMRGQTLHLVHAWRRPSPSGARGLNPQFVTWLEDDHRKALEAAEGRLAREFPAVSTQLHLSEGAPADALHAFAASATALVVGTRGRGPLRRTLLGSTSHSLLLYIDAPTIVVSRQAAA